MTPFTGFSVPALLRMRDCFVEEMKLVVFFLLLTGCTMAAAETMTLAEVSKDPSMIARAISPNPKQVAWMCSKRAELEAGVAELEKQVSAIERELARGRELQAKRRKLKQKGDD